MQVILRKITQEHVSNMRNYVTFQGSPKYYGYQRIKTEYQ